MRPFTRLLLLAVPFLAAASLTAQTLVDPSGHWEGSVMVPNAEVAVEIDLAKGADSDLAGTFGAPDQNLRGLPLGNIVVKDRSLSFQVKGGPPGERAFSGTISDDGQLLSGDYSQGGYTIPFLLTRKGGPQLEAPARSAAISKALEGIWGGAIGANGAERRLVLTLTNQPDGTSAGHFLNVDEGLEIPISAITQRASSLVLEVKALGGSYTGTLDAAGTELVGTWTQGPAVVPITLRRAAR